MRKCKLSLLGATLFFLFYSVPSFATPNCVQIFYNKYTPEHTQYLPGQEEAETCRTRQGRQRDPFHERKTHLWCRDARERGVWIPSDVRESGQQLKAVAENQQAGTPVPVIISGGNREKEESAFPV